MQIFLNYIGGTLLGSVFGSFFAALAWASIQGAPLWRKRSICDFCGQRLTALELVPVFSYLFLKGRCRNCGKKIPLYHLAMELIPAAMGVAFVWRDGLNYQTALHICLAAAVISACGIDLIFRRIPDVITLGCLALLPLELVLNPELTFKNSLLGYLAGFGLPFLLAFIFSLLRHKAGLGQGDMKLYALAGAFLGWKALPFLFLFSSLTGILVFMALAPFLKKGILNFRLPFGPCIGIVFILLLIFPALPYHFYFLNI